MIIINLQVGDDLNAASHVIGDLAPAIWYELSIEAYNDAGIERVILFADTHRLDGGEIYLHIMLRKSCQINLKAKLSGCSRNLLKK